VLALLIVESIGLSFGAEVYKCVSMDKKVVFTDTPCEGATSVKSLISQVPDTKHFSNYQINTAFDCMEALESLIYRDANPKVVSEAETTNLRNQFNKLCPSVGFKTPDGPRTRYVNLEYVKKLRKNLDDNNHTGPTFGRSYEGGRRSPPVFSGY
jgi:hypothetical protein